MKNVITAVIGRPSCGKSTFINTITENKVSIVSSIPQSTRSMVRGIYTDSRGQIIFIDSPGLHIDNRDFNIKLTKSAIQAIREADIILYIIDGNDKPGDEEKKTAFYASTSNKPVIVLINKSDTADKKNISNLRDFVKQNVPNAEIFTGSALNDEGLDGILIELYKYATEREDTFAEDTFTDASLDFRVAEMIREVIFNNTKDEIPHAVCVDVTDMNYNDNKVTINSVIFCERDSQKGILIGKGGNMIKLIRQKSQKNLRTIFPTSKVELNLIVKVNPKWKKNKVLLEKNGIV